MRLAVAIAAFALMATSAGAQGSNYVAGHVRSDGTYVPGHYRTNPNETRADNWSTQGNVNPYTGRPGTKPLYGSTYSPPSYGSSGPSYGSSLGSSYGSPGRSVLGSGGGIVDTPRTPSGARRSSPLF